ncbi:calcineurin-like phosphoesterase [Penicillium sp. DV-2018c]|nr:calcineurin-like phosphoesterase [Penicillium sp. DV-2018c]
MIRRAIGSFFKKPTISLQILSDLHLEINQQYAAFEVPVCSKYLILAGDIGRLQDYDNYLSFLQTQAANFEKVFLVLGNHEFYGESFESGHEKATRLAQEPSLNGRVVLLHQQRYDIPNSDITILGCTLWSSVPEESKEVVQRKIQDYRQIRGWKVDQHNAAHQSDLAWLRNEIQTIHRESQTQSSTRSVVVVTHHAPSLKRTSRPEYEKNPWSVAFGTDLVSQRWEGVKVWVFGHTHYTTDFKQRGIRIVSNQRGYVLPWLSKKDSNSFDAGKVVWV